MTDKDRLHPEQFATKLGSALNSMLQPDGVAADRRVVGRLNQVIENSDQFEESTLIDLARTLREVAERALSYADALEKEGADPIVIREFSPEETEAAAQRIVDAMWARTREPGMSQAEIAERVFGIDDD